MTDTSDALHKSVSPTRPDSKQGGTFSNPHLDIDMDGIRCGLEAYQAYAQQYRDFLDGLSMAQLIDRAEQSLKECAAAIYAKQPAKVFQKLAEVRDDLLGAMKRKVTP